MAKGGNGTGMVRGGACGSCDGQGTGGMGNMGRGRGGIAREEQTPASFVKRRDKVHAGKGAIIGSILVDGKQIKGGVTSDIGEVLAAGERDATDAIDRARIPRRYHEAVKGYFSDVRKEMGKRHGGTKAPATADRLRHKGGETKKGSAGTSSEDE